MKLCGLNVTLFVEVTRRSALKKPREDDKVYFEFYRKPQSEMIIETKNKKIGWTLTSEMQKHLCEECQRFVKMYQEEETSVRLNESPPENHPMEEDEEEEDDEKENRHPSRNGSLF
eukprot:Trichotokara_eunicae@DN10031_c0_g1_i1.p2